MSLARLALDEAEGAILAHSVRLPGGRLAKGRVLDAGDIDRLRAAGIAHVAAVRLAPDDIGEDAAAAAIAEAARGAGLALGPARTGRCNLYAERRGVLVYDRARLDALNRLDEAVTVAAVAPFELVEAGGLAATVKIIPLAVAGAVARRAVDGAQASPFSLAPLQTKRVALVQTLLPGFRRALLEKARAVMAARLAGLGSELVADLRCPHEEAALATVLGGLEGVDIALVLGASATVDRGDVVPAAIAAAGGAVIRFGMPVDPGNLTLLARIGALPVLGLPGSARSPRIHGFDWILWRLLADLPVGPDDITAMGAGGLLKEIPLRPLPRLRASPPHRPRPAAPRIAVAVLAAGRSRRMGARNKLLAPVAGVPMVRRVATAALRSRARPVIVVTGYQAEVVSEALAGLDVTVVHNAAYAEGLSTSLAAAVAAVPGDADGLVVCLGDMPLVSATVIDRLSPPSPVSPRSASRPSPGAAATRCCGRAPTSPSSGGSSVTSAPATSSGRTRKRCRRSVARTKAS